jgi:hypothetical protein
MPAGERARKRRAAHAALSVARPARRLRAGIKTMRLPAFRYPFICRFFLRHCRARPGNPCERKARSDLPIRLSEPQFSMDHRVKPRGDEEFCKTRALKNAPRGRTSFSCPAKHRDLDAARPCSAGSPPPLRGADTNSRRVLFGCHEFGISG